MLRLPRRLPRIAATLCCALVAMCLQATTSSPVPTLAIDALGKGTTPLGGPWQFHLGDDPNWAQPQANDAAWEQLTADTTWGAQGHPAYVGYAWYRKRLHISTAPGAKPDLALFIRHIDDAYEIYWNGVPIGHYGSMPPHPFYLYNASAPPMQAPRSWPPRRSAQPKLHFL